MATPRWVWFALLGGMAAASAMGFWIGWTLHRKHVAVPSLMSRRADAYGAVIACLHRYLHVAKRMPSAFAGEIADEAHDVRRLEELLKEIEQACAAAFVVGSFQANLRAGVTAAQFRAFSARLSGRDTDQDLVAGRPLTIHDLDSSTAMLAVLYRRELGLTEDEIWPALDRHLE